MSWLHLMILIPFIIALLVPFLCKKFASRVHPGWFVFFVPFFMFLYFSTLIPEIAQGNTISSALAWIPSLNINLVLYLDGLSLIFSLLITGIGSLVFLYSIYYMSKAEALHNFYIYLLLFMGAMLGVVLADNIFLLYVFWELTSIASFLLIAYWFERKNSRFGALKSMLITVLGGLSMLAGFIMLTIMTDSYSIREIISNIVSSKSHSLFIPAMILVLIGAFTKSAQFPFSTWLPVAMEAPTPISAYLHSATMVKAGIYLVARLTPVFGGTAEWFWIISATGLITLLYGSFNAVRQMDLKALLAYSTISQLGLIMSLLGIGSIAMYYGVGDEALVYALASFTAIFHLVNHSTFKGCLFMVVGIIDHETGTRDIRRLGGLMQLMPVSFTLMLIGSFAMAGLPPFNGFLSKELFFTAVLKASQIAGFNMEALGILFPIIAWIASVFTFVYCMIIVFKVFRGNHLPHKLEKKAHEAPLGMLIAPAVLAALVIAFFFFPNLLSQYLLQPAWAAILPALAEAGALQVKVIPWHGLTPELFMTIGVIALGTFMYLSLRKWTKIYDLYPDFIALNSVYKFGLRKLEISSRKITNSYMTGSVRDYLLYIFSFIIVIIGGFLWLFNKRAFDFSHNAPISIYELILVLCLLFAALSVLFSKSRLNSILATCAVGFLVSGFFVLFRAPDLALTQIVVETATTVLFLLCFYHLPQLKKEIAPLRFKGVNALISLGIGCIVTIMALSASGTKLFPSISKYYEDSYRLAGAKNIVNSILVDFRGIDTMLEISVLCLAGLGVYVLIKLRLAGGKKHEEIK